MDDCRTWISQHDLNSAQAAAQNEWLAGFLTGYNTFADPRRRTSTFFRFDMATLPSAVTAQCRADPTLDVYTAAQRFLSTKTKRPSRR